MLAQATTQAQVCKKKRKGGDVNVKCEARRTEGNDLLPCFSSLNFRDCRELKQGRTVGALLQRRVASARRYFSGALLQRRVATAACCCRAALLQRRVAASAPSRSYTNFFELSCRGFPGATLTFSTVAVLSSNWYSRNWYSRGGRVSFGCQVFSELH